MDLQDNSSQEEEEEELLLLFFINKASQKVSPTRRRKIWVKKIYQEREEKGIYTTLIQTMRVHDKESYFR